MKTPDRAVWEKKEFLIIVAFSGMIAVGLLSLLLGQDRNYDLLNYHLYNPFAVINSRLAIDHNAAFIQTYLNPTLDLLTTYPFFRIAGPYGYAFLMGMLQGINIIILVMIALELLRSQMPDQKASLQIALALLAALLGISGALSISEVGTAFGDLTTSVFNLIAVYCAVKLVGNPGNAGWVKYAGVCGLAAGVAAGLKLTNGVYVVAVLCAIPIFTNGNRLKIMAVTTLSVAAGFLITHGWWSVYLYSHSGNPVFPFFNNLFKSDLYPEARFAPTWFFPKTWLETIFYPFYFSWQNLTAQIPFRDLRFPIAYVCAILLIGWTVYARTINHLTGKINRPFGLFITFVIIAYILWQAMFCIQRYAITLELLLPILILMTFTTIFGRFGRKIFVACGVILAVTTLYPSWGRLSLSAPFYQVNDKSLKEMLENRTIILGGQALTGSGRELGTPSAYLIPSLNPKGSVWLADCFSSADCENARRKLLKENAPILITNQWSPLDIAVQILSKYGLPPSGNCQTFASVADPRLLCVMLSSKTEGFVWEASQLPSQIGRFQNGYLEPIREGEQGLLSSGPTVVLGPGHHGFFIDYSAESASTEPLGRWDVVSNRARLAAGCLVGSNGKIKRVQGVIVSSEIERGLEIRSWYSGSGKLKIYRIGLVWPESGNLQQDTGQIYGDSYPPDGCPVFYTMGQKLSFSGGQIEPFLQKGWGIRESWGTWSDGPLAELHLLMEEVPADRQYELILECKLFPFSPGKQKVNVLLNGEQIGVIASDIKSKNVVLPFEGKLLQRSNRIVFKIDRPVSPAELGHSQDRRKLGLGLIWLQIVSAQGQVPKSTDR